MSILLDPADLGFKRPFNREVCQVLHLTNNNQDAVVFKVKTTAPKHYCVRPNSGRIEPGKHVEVQVLLQAMKDEPAPDAKCKDKFLVQTVAVTKDMEFANVSSIFEKATKSSIQERKIRVTWQPADDPSAESQEEPNGTNVTEEEPPAYSSPKGNYETPAAPIAKGTNDSSPIPPPDFNDSDKREYSTPQVNETKATSAKSPTASSGNTNVDYESRLSDANAQIQRLKEKLADQGLRQRKIGGESDKSPAALVQQQAQSIEAGVPVKIVAGLCLLSFLIAYFFF
ncbi:Putative MSP domain protein [Aspergillus calidoustus]|uniref:Putative MSP domain protein n=1 Tax=Aspergillus calidoustus TaxID=454130 RepID=A0A0U5FTH5_ASPCI|nr:Putative MSP domain protein [Aspergillus calidoustus]